MSGICGICQPGAELERARLDAMLARLPLPGESRREGMGGKSVALGVSQRWPFQQVAAIPRVRIAVDADLLDLRQMAVLLAEKDLDAGQMSLAEQLAWLYVLRGINFVEYLSGAFAFALWDEIDQRLVLTIDRLGIKSLYWSQEGDRLLFASHAGAVKVARLRPSEINPAAVMQYLLFSMVPAPLTIYRGMEKLRPGFLLVYEKGRVRQQRYWDLEYCESDNYDVGYWAPKVREEMRGAIHRHLDGLSAQTSGAYLSGGTDSSSVVAFMSERFDPVHTFTISFPEARYNETEFAQCTAERFRTRHHQRCLSPQGARHTIPKLIQYYDEPFANSSSIAAYHCALLACERGVETLLAGDGGDELFAGNEHYARDNYFALYHSLPRWLRRGIIEPVAAILPGDDGWLSLLPRYLQRAYIPNPRRIFSYQFFLSRPPEEAFDSGFLAAAPPEGWMEIAEAHFRESAARSELNRLLYLDVKMILADNDLRKVAGTAELAGIRVRFPLLDHRVAELSSRIPTRLKLKGFKKRYIFKQAMEGILPPKVLYKKKHGFGVPLSHWFLKDAQLNSLARDVLRDARTRQRGYFRPEFLDQLIAGHRNQHAVFYGQALWYVLALELWHRQHLESKCEAVYA